MAKFEFQKLELPQTQKEEPTPLYIYNDEIKVENDTLPEQNSPKKSTILRDISLILLTCLASVIGFIILQQFQSSAKTPKIQPRTSVSQPKSLLDSLKPAESKPKYVNYFDSIIFLNDIKGEKRVISKGFDEYLKKDKIIIKAQNNYYNCFCQDLVNAYKVGDLIP